MSKKLRHANTSVGAGRWLLGWAGTLLLAISLLGLASPAFAAKYNSKYAAIVMDADTGAVLFEDNADARRYPASLTKMMTLYLLFEAMDAGRLQMTTMLPVSRRAAHQAPTKLGLRAGTKVSVESVILGLITKSANDAAVVAAEALGGTEAKFAQIMTERARKLGMTNTTFRNASGLPDRRQITTARDLAKLSRALIQTFPHHYHLFSTPEFEYGGRVHANHNRLNTWYQGADGIKTGYIRASGFNLATSAVRDNRRLIGVVLGGISPGARDQEMARLLDAAFAAAPSEPLTIEVQNKNRRPAERQIAQAAAAARQASRGEGSATSSDSIGLDNWGIQVGAFSKQAPARKAAARAARLAPRQLDGAAVEVTPLQRRKGRLFRSRIVGLSEAEAREACRVLQRRKMNCVPLTPAEIRATTRTTANS